VADDDPFTGNLFSGGNGDPKSPAALYGRTSGLFQWGSYRPNPLSDPASGGTGLSGWWSESWTALRSIIPARSQLPPAANFDKNWADNKVTEIVQSLQGLESAQTPNARRGFADLVLQKFDELQTEFPLDALAAVPALTEAATAFRDASFTAAKGVVARTLNDDRPAGETVRDTYLLLELTDAAATHYWIGGDPPDSLDIKKGEPAGVYLGIVTESLDVPVPGASKSDFGTVFSNALTDFGMTQNTVNSLRALPSKTPAQDQALAAAQRKNGDAVDSVANLTQAFARQAGEQAASKQPDDDAVVQIAEMAMVCAEAMRNVTGVIRPDAQPGVTEPMTDEEVAQRRSAGEAAASEIEGKFEERENEGAGLGI
jgi:hypothetical protein